MNNNKKERASKKEAGRDGKLIYFFTWSLLTSGITVISTDSLFKSLSKVSC